MYTIREAIKADANQMAKLRPLIDSETEYMDRQPGEDFLDEAAWQAIIAEDHREQNHLFLVVEKKNELIGYSRCAGEHLARLQHQAAFGVCILKEHWGQGIGGELLRRSIDWARQAGLHKLTLKVMASNTSAIRLYTRFGFEQEGILRDDKRLGDGQFCDTIVMALFLNQ